MTDLNTILRAKLEDTTTVKFECPVKAGDNILYSCALGRVKAVVRSVTFGPTARPGYSIPWLNITLLADPATGRRFDSNIYLPGDENSLSMYKVTVDNKPQL